MSSENPGLQSYVVFYPVPEINAPFCNVQHIEHVVPDRERTSWPKCLTSNKTQHELSLLRQHFLIPQVIEEWSHIVKQFCGHYKGAARVISRKTGCTWHMSSLSRTSRVTSTDSKHWGWEGNGNKLGTPPAQVKGTGFLRTPFKSILGWSRPAVIII